MSSLWISLSILLIVVGISQAILALWLAWEHYRHTYTRFFVCNFTPVNSKAAILIPCKGLDLDLEENLRFLLKQNYPDYEVVFVVETPDDPACETIDRILSKNTSIPAKIVFSGKATHCGQKVHNLLVATKEVSDDVEILAFADSDAQPKPDWLHHLVCLLPKLDVLGAVSAYRCLVPVENSLPNWLLYSINSMIAGLIGPTRTRHLAWGGTWAIRRNDFERLIRPTWQNKLNDDLSASAKLLSEKLQIDFEPRCMVASSVDADWYSMFEFIRRQYIQVRFYTPTWWRMMLIGGTLRVGFFWSGLIASIVGIASQAEWMWLPIVFTALYYIAGCFSVYFRHRASQIFLPNVQRQLAAAQRFELWCFPIVGLVGWIAFLTSMIGNTLSWRGISYRIFNDGTIKILNSPEELEAAEDDSTCSHLQIEPSKAA